MTQQRDGNLRTRERQQRADIVVVGGLPRPAPHITEHATVQVLDEFLGQQIAASAECPVLRPSDVVLLRLIQLAPEGDMRRDQLTPFLWGEWRGIVWLIEEIAHRSSQNRRGFVSRTISSRPAS